MKIDKNNDFYQRETGVSSTSKYIQTKNVDEQGNPVANDIKGIPDQKIIQPNLTKAKAETYEISTGGGLFDSLLASLGVPSLKKTKVKKEINETPPDFAKSQYGQIQVKETKGGFVEIFDQTIGNQRTMRLHPAGTYNQVLPDGTVQDKVVGDKVTFVDNEWNIVVGKDFVEVVSGNNKIHIKKDNQLNINGNNNVNIDKDSNTVIGGKSNLDIKGKSVEKVGLGKDIDITGTCTEKISKDFKQDVTGNVNRTVMGNETDVIGGSLNLLCSGNIVLSGTSIIVNGKNTSAMFGDNAVLNGDVTVNGDLKVNGNVDITGSLTVGGRTI